MKSLLPHSIPENISDIVFRKDDEKFEALKEIVEDARWNEVNYIHAFKAMIFLTELEESKNLKKYDLKMLLFCSIPVSIAQLNVDMM